MHTPLHIWYHNVLKNYGWLLYVVNEPIKWMMRESVLLHYIDELFVWVMDRGYTYKQVLLGAPSSMCVFLTSNNDMCRLTSMKLQQVRGYRRVGRVSCNITDGRVYNIHSAETPLLADAACHIAVRYYAQDASVLSQINIILSSI